MSGFYDYNSNEAWKSEQNGKKEKRPAQIVDFALERGAVVSDIDRGQRATSPRASLCRGSVSRA